MQKLQHADITLVIRDYSAYVTIIIEKLEK